MSKGEKNPRGVQHLAKCRVFQDDHKIINGSLGTEDLCQCEDNKVNRGPRNRFLYPHPESFELTEKCVANSN